MLVALQTVNWETVAKIWGPLGVGFVVFLFLVVGAAKLFQRFLTDTLADVRKDRDVSREALKEQATEFTVALKVQNQEFTASLRYRDEKLKDVVDALDRIGRQRRS